MNNKEALEFLSNLASYGCANCSKYEKCQKLDECICENAKFIILKSLEELENENIKLKEVIKSIITKGVNELILKNTKTSDNYNKIIKQLEYFDELTQEEYELLKEVLENGN